MTRICEECHAPIENEMLAVVVYSKTLEFWHRFVHKGKCHDATEQRIESKGHKVIWRELQRFNAIGLEVDRIL